MEKYLDINPIRLEKLNNDEFAQFIKSMLTMVEEATPEKLGVQASILNELRKCLEDLTEASRQNRRKRLTPYK